MAMLSCRWWWEVLKMSLCLGRMSTLQKGRRHPFVQVTWVQPVTVVTAATTRVKTFLDTSIVTTNAHIVCYATGKVTLVLLI